MSAQKPVPRALTGLRLGPATWPSGRKPVGEPVVGEWGVVRGLWLQLSHLPREAVLTIRRPGSKHSGISMETAAQD